MRRLDGTEREIALCEVGAKRKSVKQMFKSNLSYRFGMVCNFFVVGQKVRNHGEKIQKALVRCIKQHWKTITFLSPVDGKILILMQNGNASEPNGKN